MDDETKDTTDKTGLSGSATFDFTKLLSQYKLPGVDFASIVDRERKNIEALTKANMIAFEGWQALLRRQSEILQETMAQTVAVAHNEEGAAVRADVAKQGFEKALANMRDLAEMATKSQKEAFEVVRKRAVDNMAEISKPPIQK